MTSEPIHVCLIAAWPAIDALAPDRVKPRYHYRKTLHPSSWVRSLALALSQREDVRAVSVLVDTREVRRAQVVNDGKLALIFIPKWEPGQTDPFHGHWPARLRLRPWLRRLRPDIVHGFGTETANGWLAVHSGYPNVVKLQGIVAELRPYLEWSRFRIRAVEWVERQVVRRAGGLIASSPWAQTWARQYRPADAVRYIPNVVSPEFLQADGAASTRTCVFAGTFTEFKNPLLVIRAFGALNDPEARLVMIGDGFLRDAGERLAAELGLSSRVTFTGRLPRAGVVDQFRQARCLVVASRMDTSPNVVVEAHAMGIPVVGCRAGGIPDMIRDGTDGFLVPPEDPVAMADRIGCLLRDPDLATRLGAAARQRVRQTHSPLAVGEQHMAWYREQIARFMTFGCNLSPTPSSGVP